MKVGRESVWLVVPFTVGIATVSYSLPLLYGHIWATVALLSVAAGGIVLCLFASLKAVENHYVVKLEKDGDLLEKLCGHALPPRGTGIWKERVIYGSLFLFAGVMVCVLANLAELTAAPAGAEGVSEGIVGGGFVSEEAVGMSRMRLFISGCGERFRAMLDGMPFRDSLSNALLKALLAGDRSSLPWDVRNSFRAAGASHLLALSGLHLSIIYLVVSRMLSVTGNSPIAVKVRSVLIILFSGFFTLITGASPSLVRAFLFIALRECAILTRRRTDNINIFCMSLMLQLTLNPNDISSVGFQLSYLAMLGIFILEPPLERFWDVAGEWLAALRKNVPKNGTISSEAKTSEMGTAFGTVMRKIWSLCAISISCQVFTAPAVLLYFGTFPTYFLLTNLLCLPLSNILITVSVVAVLLQMPGLCPAFLLSIIDFLVHTLIYILDVIAGM